MSLEALHFTSLLGLVFKFFFQTFTKMANSTFYHHTHYFNYFGSLQLNIDQQSSLPREYKKIFDRKSSPEFKSPKTLIGYYLTSVLPAKNKQIDIPERNIAMSSRNVSKGDSSIWQWLKGVMMGGSWWC